MPKIKANNINLYYESYGQGQPIVLVTGFNADRTVWQSVVDVYAKHYRVIIFDNRGSGLSDTPEVSYTIEMMADDLAGLCLALGIAKSHIMGVSMGGAIAQAFAFKYPQVCQSIVIVNSFTQIDIRFALFAKGRYEMMQLGASNQALTEIALGLCFSSNYLNRPGVVKTMLDAASANPATTTLIGYKNQLKALCEFNSASWLDKIKVPCLLIGSDEDGIVSQADMENIAKQIPDALYYGFRGVSHMPFIEAPEMFNKLVLMFINYHN